MRQLALVAVVVVAVVQPAFAQNYTETAVSEADYAKWRKLQYARALADARTSYDGKNKAKYQAEYQRELKATGWSEERLDELQSALLEAVDFLAYEKGDEEGADMSEIKASIAQLNKTTVATARAHYAELRSGGDEDARAEEQVQKERREAAAGQAPTLAALLGTWVPDIDATFNDIAPGLPIDAKTREPMEKAMDGMSYTFGPGDAITVTSKDANGKPKVEKGTFRLDGRVIAFKAGGSKHEYTLDAGMKGAHLTMGKGFGKVLYRKK